MKKKIYNAMVRFARFLILVAQRMASKLPLKNKIVFNSIPDFGDSTAEVFKHILTMDEFKKTKIIWYCTHAKKYGKYPHANVSIRQCIPNPFFRLKNLYTESTAKVCVYSHSVYGNVYNKKQMRLVIDHGSYGIKKGLGMKKSIDYSTHRVKTRGKETEKVRPLGLPRNDRLFDDPTKTKELLGYSHTGKIIIWMPTFKRFQSRSLFQMERNDFAADKKTDISLQQDERFYPCLEAMLKKTNTLLIIKYHPNQDMRYIINKETANIKILSDAQLLEAGIPLYSLIGATDGLITDFSSVAYDYLLINRPVGFDITDLEDYIAGGTVAVDDPLSHMPGYKIKDVDSFCGFIESVSTGEDDFEKERRKMLKTVHIHKDNQSSKRVAELILSHLSEAKK